jgi:hypothetical protein
MLCYNSSVVSFVRVAIRRLVCVLQRDLLLATWLHGLCICTGGAQKLHAAVH